MKLPNAVPPALGSAYGYELPDFQDTSNDIFEIFLSALAVVSDFHRCFLSAGFGGPDVVVS